MPGAISKSKLVWVERSAPNPLAAALSRGLRKAPKPLQAGIVGRFEIAGIMLDELEAAGAKQGQQWSLAGVADLLFAPSGFYPAQQKEAL